MQGYNTLAHSMLILALGANKALLQIMPYAGKHELFEHLMLVLAKAALRNGRTCMMIYLYLTFQAIQVFRIIWR